jgi:thioredoxin-like negative regulator of GroEL
MKTILYFTADWCRPCKMVRPIVEDMNKDGFSIQIIDSDIEIELLKKFEIKAVPTFILLIDGNETKRIFGAQTRAQLESFINNE